MHRFASIILVDGRGWVLLQERDDQPVIDPGKWGFVGGHVEPGEEFEPAAYRELEEETGLHLQRGELALWREFPIFHDAYDSHDTMQVFVAPTHLTDADIECHEGRQIVFVPPETVPALQMTAGAALALPIFLDSDLYRSMCP